MFLSYFDKCSSRAYQKKSHWYVFTAATTECERKNIFHLSKRSMVNIKVWSQSEGTKLLSAPTNTVHHTGRDPSNPIYRWWRFISTTVATKDQKATWLQEHFWTGKSLARVICLPTNSTPTGRTWPQRVCYTHCSLHEDLNIQYVLEWWNIPIMPFTT